jgi:hypothetical protein
VTRRQTANRPQGMFTPTHASRPGEQVQIGLPLKSWRLFYAAAGWSAASLSYWIGDINAAELCRRRVL